MSRLLNEFPGPARLPFHDRQRLRNIERIFPMCSIECESDDPEVLYVERLCAQYSLKVLFQCGIEVACDCYRSHLWTQM